MRRIRTIVLLLLVFAAAPASLAQDNGAQTEEAGAPEALTANLVQARRDAAEADASLDDAARESILAAYDDALKFLATAQEWKEKAAQFEEFRTTAPERKAQTEAQLAESMPAPTEGISEEASLADLELMLSTAEAELASRRQQITSLREDEQTRAERRRTIPGIIATARQRLEEARQALGTPLPDNPNLATARQTALRAQTDAIQSEISALEQELSSYEARGNLLNMRMDLAAREAEYTEARVEALADAVADRRREQAREAAAQTRAAIAELEELAPEIGARILEISQQNEADATLRASNAGPDQQQTQAQTQLEATLQTVKDLEERFESIRQRMQAAGGSEMMALRLRQELEALPQERELERRYDARVEEIADAQLAWITYQEMQEDFREQYPDVEAATTQLLEQLQGDYSEDELQRISQYYRQQLETRRELLQALKQDYQRLSDTLFELNVATEQHLAVADAFRDFINENILWMSTAKPLGVRDLIQAIRQLPALLSPVQWADIAAAIARDARNAILLYVPSILLLLLLLFLRFRARKYLKKLGDLAKRKWHVRFQETSIAALLSILCSLPLPLLLYFLGWRLQIAGRGIELADHFGAALIAASALTLLLQFLRYLFLKRGLAEAHFDWVSGQLRSTRRAMTLLLLVGTPLLLFVFTFEDTFTERIAFVLLLSTTGVFMFLYLRHLFAAMGDDPRGGLVAESRAVRMLVYLLFAVTPILLGVVAFTGYYFTGLVLAIQLFYSISFVVFVVFCGAMGRRAIIVTRRRLAIEQTRRRREAAEAEDDAVSETTEQEEIDEELDLVRIDVQTSRLLRSASFLVLAVGLYFIWVDTLPALRFLEDWELYQVQVEEVVPVAGEEGLTETEPRLQSITAANILLCILMIVVTVVAAHNIPGLLEIALLQRLELGAGERYATNAIIRYILIAVGAFFAFKTLGVGWSNIQWLVAAVGIGLGFGLQEIFANFVSGLILLFERPIRVGDIVTIGNESGMVSKIRIRATTVTDWDRKELVIPNKEFITSQVTNWSLSDSVLRLVLPVGVAYGSNTQLVYDTLLEVVKEHPEVLADPEPMVVFNGFGDSTLDFDVRVFVKLAVGIITRTQLNMAINAAFAERGIEIAFPQRDVHLRSGFEKLQPQHGAPRRKKQLPTPPETTEIPESPTDSLDITGGEGDEGD